MIIRRLVITADDLGLAPGVDRGIIEAAAAGSVSAVSVIVNLGCPSEISNIIARLQLGSPSVGIGLHFNCTAGRPLTSAPSLTQRGSGDFLSLRHLIARAFAGRIDPADVAKECEAQLEVLLVAGGGATHLDSHRHVHTLPGIWSGVMSVASRYRVRHVRLPLEPWRIRPLDLRATVRKALLRTAVYVSTRRAALPANGSSGFAGISLGGNSHFLPRLLRVLDELRPGTTELMVHPGFADPAVLRYDGYVYGRDIERAALISAPVRERLARGDIALMHFGA